MILKYSLLKYEIYYFHELDPVVVQPLYNSLIKMKVFSMVDEVFKIEKKPTRDFSNEIIDLQHLN